MNSVNPATAAWRAEYQTDAPVRTESNVSGISWAAVIGGAFVAASLALILGILGVGLGLSSISPWSGAGMGLAAFGTSAIIWLVVTQAIAFGLGGYLAGRLRTKWSMLHGDEVYFRDTAHGLLVWAVGVAIAAALLGSAALSIVSTGSRLAATATAAAAGGLVITPATGETAKASSAEQLSESASPGGTGAVASSNGYLVDALVRTDGNASNQSPLARAELGRILAEAMRKGALPDADRSYAAHVIAAQTGLPQADAEKRLDAIYAQSKSIAADAELASRTATDNARKASAKASLWIFVALLAGAFCASLAATIGGKQRDSLSVRVADMPASHP